MPRQNQGQVVVDKKVADATISSFKEPVIRIPGNHELSHYLRRMSNGVKEK